MSLSWSVFGLLLALVCTGQGSELKEKAEKRLAGYYPGSVKISFDQYPIPGKLKASIEKKVGQKFFRPELYRWIIQVGPDSVNYALVDNALGKSLPITFLVLFDEKGKILYSCILKYREPIGGAVVNESWNRQFEGRSSDSGFDVGKDIQGISGATISVYSVTKGIRKLAYLVREWNKK